MELDKFQRDELDHLWIETLLKSSFAGESPSQDDRAIARMWNAIDASNTQEGTKESTPSIHRRRHFLLRTAPIYSIAVSLIAIWFAFNWGLFPNEAMASVINASRPFPGTRKYKIELNLSSSTSSPTTKTAWLFLDDRNRYAIEHPSWFRGQRSWIGGDGQRTWVVPFVGPALTGETSIVSKWLNTNHTDTPYLHVQTILQRMQKGYSLSIHRTEPIQLGSEQSIECKHVIGELKHVRPFAPTRIELWAREDNGMAIKLILAWHSENSDKPWKVWTIEFDSSPELAENFFEMEGHKRMRQRTIQVRSNRDTELWEMEIQDANGPNNRGS